MFRRSLPCPVPALHLLLLAAAPGSAAAQDLSAEAIYTVEAIQVLKRGPSDAGAVLGNLDLLLHVGVDERRTTAFLYVLANHGDPLSEHVGDAQGASNIEAPEALRLFEAWIEHDVPARGLSFLGGLYDLNSEFDVVEASSLFVNSSFGIGPDYSQSGPAGPSIFPVTSLALRARWSPSPTLYAQAAILDGVPGDPDRPRATTVRLSSADGALLAGEVGWYLAGRGDRAGGTNGAGDGEDGSAPALALAAPVGRRFEPPNPAGKVALGLWYYTRDFVPLEDRLRDGDASPSLGSLPGVYALVERRVAEGRNGVGRLDVFARAGAADPRVHRFVAYTGAGAVYTGAVPGRPEDRLGLAVAVAWNGDRYRDAVAADGGATTRAETVVELTYGWRGGEAWTLQPDLQWVRHPDTDPRARDALLLGIRAEVGVGF